MANTITINITDDIVENRDVTTIVVEDYAPNPVTGADDITFTDGGDLSAYPLEISRIGKGDNEADTFRFDLWGFDDDFTVSIKSEGVEDSFVIDHAYSYTETSGVYTIVYMGSDGLEHTVKIDPGDAQMVINLVCFTPDVRVETPAGLRAVGTLKAGDLVQTMDHGAQVLRWIGRRTIVFPKGAHHFKPILVAAGSIDGTVPRCDILLSPQHRVLLRGPSVQKVCGMKTALTPVKALIGAKGIRQAQGRRSAQYVSLLFDQHEIIMAEGMACESYLPRPYARRYLDKASIAAIDNLVPGAFAQDAECSYPAALPLLSVRQGKETAVAAIDWMWSQTQCKLPEPEGAAGL